MEENGFSKTQNFLALKKLKANSKIKENNLIQKKKSTKIAQLEFYRNSSFNRLKNILNNNYSTHDTFFYGVMKRFSF